MVSARHNKINRRLEDTPEIVHAPMLLILQKLMSLHGLAGVKQAVTNLMELQLQNYDAEMRGEKVQLVSLHRVFMGNPGTQPRIRQ